MYCQASRKWVEKVSPKKWQQQKIMTKKANEPFNSYKASIFICRRKLRLILIEVNVAIQEKSEETLSDHAFGSI